MNSSSHLMSTNWHNTSPRTSQSMPHNFLCIAFHWVYVFRCVRQWTDECAQPSTVGLYNTQTDRRGPRSFVLKMNLSLSLSLLTALIFGTVSASYLIYHKYQIWKKKQYMFCLDLRGKIGFCTVWKYWFFYNQNRKCLLRGTKWM